MRINRQDAVRCAGVIAFAVILRFWNLTSLGLTHFDEGAYTMTGRWLATFNGDGPGFQPTFSPPLFPSLVGAAFAVFGVQDYIAIAVSAVAGSLTVGLIYLVGASWFGRNAGLAAGLMLGAAEYHIVFSRLALTDGTFTFLFWAAVACLFQGATTRNHRWFIAGGVATGLCWNTKYHGFFPLAITGLWLLWRFARGERPPLRSFSLACGIAAAMYLPWVIYVQSTIGYGALLRTHIDHSFGNGVFVTSPSAFAFYFSHWLVAPLLGFAIAGVAASIAERRPAARFLLFTAGVFLTAATMYLSFPRLVLPVVPAICLLAAYGLDALARVIRVPVAVALAGGTVIVVAFSVPRDTAVLAMRTDAYRQAAAYVRDADLPTITQLSKNFYFYEESPSIEMRFQTTQNLEKTFRSSRETILAVDPIVERLPETLRWFETARNGRSAERIFPIQMYEPVYYQGFDPTAFDSTPRVIAPFRPGRSIIAVYRVQGPAR